MARWTSSAKWAEGLALAGQCAMPLALRLSEGLGLARQGIGSLLRNMERHSVEGLCSITRNVSSGTIWRSCRFMDEPLAK